MNTVASRRVLALLAYTCLLAGPAVAQMGPIQPVLVLQDGKSETSHNRPDLPDSYAISVDVYVAADGRVSNVVVTESSRNELADQLAAAVMRERKFLPALDSKGNPIAGTVRVSVNLFKRGPRKVVKVIVKPPQLNAEPERIRRMMCADFSWEVDRLKKQADVDDASYEVMPYTSARMYMTDKHISGEVEAKFWDAWPRALRKVAERCEKDQLKFFYAEVLIPTLDGVVPQPESAVAATE
jgi:TonB family protein